MAPVMIATVSEEKCVDYAFKHTKLRQSPAISQIFIEAFARELWFGKALPG
jgi:hypothetical protein